MENQFSSLLLQQAVDELSNLPGIGRKTALRLALHLLRQPESQSQRLGESVIRLRTQVQYCQVCYNISDTETCPLCSNPRRERHLLCVVEDIRDMLAIENTGQFKGLYHVLGGVISPIEGVGPADLRIEPLYARIACGEISELILALPATVEGDTTNYYLYKILKDKPLHISVIARGIPVGDELDYTDEITLGRSILMRQPYQAGK